MVTLLHNTEYQTMTCYAVLKIVENKTKKFFNLFLLNGKISGYNIHAYTALFENKRIFFVKSCNDPIMALTIIILYDHYICAADANYYHLLQLLVHTTLYCRNRFA